VFNRDRARVLHSAALRRLAGKTQVVGPGEGAEIRGVPRTRLTHSLEVAQIGRGLAEEIGADPDLAETAGLAHDIGHPPYGHNGEEALNAIAVSCGGFEGNAQTFRILTRLEPKVLTDSGAQVGLDLSRASLDAATKYPWQRKPGENKFGVYEDDLDIFTWMRDDAPFESRCIEAQIMDWADDVAYSVHDVEDGVLAGRISLAVLQDSEERAVVAELAAKHFTDLSVSEVDDAARELVSSPALVELMKPYDSSFSGQVVLKQLTSELVGRFTLAAVAKTRAVHGDMPLCRYSANLEIPRQAMAEVALLKALAFRYVMSDPHRLEVQRLQRQLITELVEVVVARAPASLDLVFQPAWREAEDDSSKLRVVIDQVASLTDAQALAWHNWLVLAL
jgi:dGTPase